MGADAGDGEVRVERETGLDRGTRLVKSTKLCEGGGQTKICWRIFRLASIDRRNHATACSQLPRWSFAMPARSHPDVSHSVARTEAEGLANVSLCFFGATDKHLPKSDKRMGAGKISVQRQGIFTFGDALRSALGEYVDKSQIQMATRMVRDRRQGFGQLRFGRREGRHGIGHKQIAPSTTSARADPTSASTLSGSAASARSKKLRACATLSGVIPLLSQARP